MMMMMTIFYRGTGTDSTENQISNKKRWSTTMANTDDGNNNNTGTGTDTSITNTNSTITSSTRTMRRQQWQPPRRPIEPSNGRTRPQPTDEDHDGDDEDDHPPTMAHTDGNNNTGTGTTDTDPPTTNANSMIAYRKTTIKSTKENNKKNTNGAQRDEEDDDDVDDGENDTVCDWYTRQKNQPSLTKSMPLQPTEDSELLADDTLVDGNRGHQRQTELQLTWMTITV
jgi:hypothetical protein